MHGTHYVLDDGTPRLSRIVDRNGYVHAQLTWDRDRLVTLAVDGIAIDGAVVEHRVLGRVHPIGKTVITALDWARPTEIPAIAEPARLPPGAGGAIMNTIAVLALRASVPALRYAGPYPTSALWRTLARSFRTDGSEDAFVADMLPRAVHGLRTPIAIDFVPAPNERIAIAGGFVELRDVLERAVIGGVTFEPDGSPARLVDGRCEIWFGDAPYATVATLAADGSLVDGPHAVPPCTSSVIGREFPPPLRAAIAELVAELVPPPLADLARHVLVERPVVWADLGARAARATDAGFAVHAALWERIAPLGMPRLALALAEALAPVARDVAVMSAVAERVLP